MADGETRTDAVVDVVEPSSGRRRRVGVMIAAVLVPAVVAGSVWAFGSHNDRRVALVPQPTDASVAAEPPVATEPPPAETAAAATIDTTVPPTAAAVVPIAPSSTAAGVPGTVRSDGTQGCSGGKPKVFVPLLIPNLTGTDIHGWVAAAGKFSWDATCTGGAMSWAFQPINGECAPTPALVGKTYAQTPSPGTPFAIGSVTMTVTVYVDCITPTVPPTPPSPPPTPAPTPVPPPTPAPPPPPPPPPPAT